MTQKTIGPVYEDPVKEDQANKQIELNLLLEAIYQKSGYDFRGYARAHLARRMEHVRKRSGLSSLSMMIHRIIYDSVFFQDVLSSLSINVSEMFRDPFVYKTIREKVIPHLQTFPFVKIWHAGCSAGQEVYSMAILMEEEGMQDRAQFYGTDINDGILEKARQGIYPHDLIRDYTSNYQKSGGTNSFSDYYMSDYDSVAIATRLKQNILFSRHNLVTDSIFGEMHMICCRNVLIYFSEPLQNRVIKIFHDSLCHGGFLCLGTKESLRFTDYEDHFELVDEKAKIYRKRSQREMKQRLIATQEVL